MIKYKIGICFCFLLATIIVAPVNLFSQSQSNGLNHQNNSTSDKKEKVDYLIERSNKIYLDHVENSAELCRQAKSLSEEINYETGRARSVYGLARYHITKGNVDKALTLLNESILFFEQKKLLSDLASAYSLKSIILARISQNQNAILFLNKSLAIYENIRDTSGIIKCLMNLCAEYADVNDFDSSLKSIDKAKELDKINSEIEGKNKFYIPINYAGLYYKKGDFYKALHYFKLALNGARSEGIEDGEATALLNIGQCYLALDDTKNALENINQSYQIARIHGFRDEMIEALRELTKVYENTNDYKNAYLSHLQYIELKDSVYSLDKINRVAELEKILEVEKRESIINIKNLEIEKSKVDLKASAYRVYGLSFGIVLLIGLVGIVLMYFKQSKKLNAEITLQKLKVEAKNKDVMESISYAKRIQSSILTSSESLKEIFQDYFILFKPKDIVSGDFYWAYKTKNNKIVFTVADCTGHGVPGALMSMVGNSLLNEIVIENQIEEADEILNELKKGIIKTFGQKAEGESKDGMDMALCVWDKNTDVLEYAGANNSLYVYRNVFDEELKKLADENKNLNYFENSLLEIKGDKQSIAFEVDKTASFVKKVIQLKKGDQLFLSSDGYADQFGGSRDKKFTYKRLKELLVVISGKPVNQHANMLNEALESWQGNNEQVDDICVMGVRI